jgi:hypothetical protein
MIDVARSYGYARLRWPDARKSLDECCDSKGTPVLCLTTGCGVFIKRGNST